MADEHLTTELLDVEKFATCRRGQVGAILHTPGGEILTTGWNGVTRPHRDYHEHPCETLIRGEQNVVAPPIPDQPCRICVHAETRTFMRAARNGIATDGMHLLTTVAPCYRCAQLAILANIAHAEWLAPHRLTEGVGLLDAAGIRTTGPRLEPRP